MKRWEVTKESISPGRANREAEIAVMTASLDQEQTLPPPSTSFPSSVVCLRGKLFLDKAEQVGVQENLHRYVACGPQADEELARHRSSLEERRRQLKVYHDEYKGTEPPVEHEKKSI